MTSASVSTSYNISNSQSNPAASESKEVISAGMETSTNRSPQNQSEYDLHGNGNISRTGKNGHIMETDTTNSKTSMTVSSSLPSSPPFPLSPRKTSAPSSSSCSSYIKELSEAQQKVFAVQLDLHHFKTLYAKEHEKRLVLEKRVKKLQTQNSKLIRKCEQYQEHHEELKEDRKTLMERDETYTKVVTFLQCEFSNLKKHITKAMAEASKLREILETSPTSSSSSGGGKAWRGSSSGGGGNVDDRAKADACMMMYDKLEFTSIILDHSTTSIEELLSDTFLPSSTLPELEYQGSNVDKDDDDNIDGDEDEENNNDTDERENDDKFDTENMITASSTPNGMLPSINSCTSCGTVDRRDERPDSRTGIRPTYFKPAFTSFRESIQSYATRSSSIVMTSMSSFDDETVTEESSLFNGSASGTPADATAAATTTTKKEPHKQSLLDSIPYEKAAEIETERVKDMENLAKELFVSQQLQFAEYMETCRRRSIDQRQFHTFADCKQRREQESQQQQQQQLEDTSIGKKQSKLSNQHIPHVEEAKKKENDNKDNYKDESLGYIS